MSLKNFVKIASVSNLSDARYCAGMGVDQLGFNLNPTSTDAISPELFMEIQSWVSGPSLVGEFGDLAATDVIKIQQSLPLDLLETSRMDAVEPLQLLGKPISFSYAIDHHVHLSDLKSTLSYLDELVEQVVIHSNSPELYEEINSQVNFYNGRIKLIKAYNVKPDSLSLLGNYHGIQLTATKEEKTGLKDYGVVMDILEALEVD